MIQNKLLQRPGGFLQEMSLSDSAPATKELDSTP